MSSTTTTITHPDGTTVSTTTASAAARCGGSVKIYGMSLSGNVIPPALLALDTGAGEFVHKSIMGDSEMKTPEMLKCNPWCACPHAKKLCPEVAAAALRESTRSQAPDPVDERR